MAYALTFTRDNGNTLETTARTMTEGKALADAYGTRAYQTQRVEGIDAKTGKGNGLGVERKALVSGTWGVWRPIPNVSNE
jgi:hypothetical protein